MKIYMYKTNEDAQEIITRETANGLILTEVSNIEEGNFLGFSDNPIPWRTPIEERIINIENTLDLILLKQEGII